MVQPASIDDSPGFSALLNAVYPDELSTVGHQRHRMLTARSEHRQRTWKVVRDGTVVGRASASFEPYSSVPGRAFAAVQVHPEARSRGIGSALWAAVASHVEEIGATRVTVKSLDDDASTRFCERRGLARRSSSDVLGLDPRTLPPPPAAPAGVEIVSFSRFDGDLEVVYRVDHEAFQDEPSPFDSGGMTFDQWLDLTFRHPDFGADLSTLARVDGEVVGMSVLYADRERGKAANGGTGVLPQHRGRGLGSLMKRHSLAIAAEAGITAVFTENDGTNAPMLAINRALGYAPSSVRRYWVLER